MDSEGNTNGWETQPEFPPPAPALPHSSRTLSKSLLRFLGLTANLSRGSLGAEQMFAERALHSRNGVAAAAAVLWEGNARRRSDLPTVQLYSCSQI